MHLTLWRVLAKIRPMTTLIVGSLLLTSCAGSDLVRLVVDLRTDMLPVLEFESVTVTVMGLRESHLAASGADYVTGVRTADLGVLPGRQELLVSLRRAGRSTSVDQRVIVDLDQDTAITVVVTRDCVEVDCGTAERCLRAACVSAECSELRQDLCPAPECAADAECTSAVGCARGVCGDGVCFFLPNNAMCDPLDRCDPDVGCVPIDDRRIDVGARDGTDVRIGDEALLVLEPMGAWRADDRVTVTVSDGELFAPTERGTSVELAVSVAGALPPIRLAVPFDQPIGSTISLTADTMLTGDVALDVVDTQRTPLMIEGQSYTVASGFLLEDPLQIQPSERVVLAGRVNQVAFPRPGSGFGPGPYLSTTGDAPAGPPVEVVRISGGLIDPFATSDGSNGPDAGFTQIAFADPASAWGDRLYICSTSIGGGDGLYTVDGAGAFAPFAVFNNCNGMAFDYGRVLGDPGFDSPMYVNENSADFLRFDPMAGQTVLVPMPFPFNGNGYKLYAPQEAPWSGFLYLITQLDGPGMGQVWRVAQVDPWGTPELFLDNLPFPPNGGVAFTAGGPLGARMYMALRDDNVLRAYRPDGTFSDVVTGFTGIEGITVEDDEVWIVDRDAGQVLRLRR